MAQYRKEKLANNEVYHIYTRSIAKYVVFNDEEDFHRILNLCKCYQHANFIHKYSQFVELDGLTQDRIIQNLKNENQLLVRVIAYCFMPTHIHLVLQQMSDNGVSKFMSRVLNGYSRFFNTNHNRTGPLWSGRFKNVLVSTDEQLLHLTRYIHLNPTSAEIVKSPEQWEYSSYGEYIDNECEKPICEYMDLIDMKSQTYKKFVNNQKQFQKQLSIIKSILIDNYSG